MNRELFEKKITEPANECMMINRVRFSPQEKIDFQAKMEKIKEDFEEYCEKRKVQKEEDNSSKNQFALVTVPRPRKILNNTPLVI